jgi:hypothetical protein
MTLKPDIEITNSGSGFFGIYGETPKGRKWLKRNVQHFDPDECVAWCDDRRYAMDIAEAAIATGLVVQ